MPGDLTGPSAAKWPRGSPRYDWSRTPLGARESWPPSLKLIVATILASQFPMAVRWGADFVLIYNDGYLPMLGEKHPRALGLRFATRGRRSQDQLGPLHRGLLAGTREAFFSEDLPLRIRRHGGRLEEAYFTLSYSPIPDDTAPSGIGGVLMTAVETTERSRGRARIARARSRARARAGDRPGRRRRGRSSPTGSATAARANT